MDQLHLEDSRIYRHWHGGSERWAGGDSLATALMLGWRIRKTVYLDQYRCSGTRQVQVYLFEMTRDGENVAMSVIGNPYVERLVARYGLRVLPVERSDRLTIATFAQDVDEAAAV